MTNTLMITASVALPDDIFEATTVQADVLANAKNFKAALESLKLPNLAFTAGIISTGADVIPEKTKENTPPAAEPQPRKRRTRAEIAAAGGAAQEVAQPPQDVVHAETPPAAELASEEQQSETHLPHGAASAPPPWAVSASEQQPE